MKLLENINNPETFLGRVPSWVYGVIWSFMWLVIAIVVITVIGSPWGMPAGFMVSVIAFGISLRITRA